MKSLRLIGVGLIAASAAWGIAQHGHGGGAPSGMGVSERSSSDRGAPTSHQSEKQSPEQLLNQNTKLASHLQKLLPLGTSPQQACNGFRNLGQCVAAIHVAHNLGVSFFDLRARMTGSKPESLGKAIQDLKPEVNARAEKKKAEKQAKNDIDGSNS